MLVLPNAAEPPARLPVPNVLPVLLSLNVTVSPFGGVPEAKLTVAESVTLAPTFTGDETVASVVVVGAWVMVWDTAEEVLGAFVMSPL